MTAEISELEKQRDELEAQLKKVPYPETSAEDFIFLMFAPVSYCSDLDLFSMFHDEQVNISLNAAVGRLKQTREERDQFHEANNQMIFTLQAKVATLF